jgi:hypothetical protein
VAWSVSSPALTASGGARKASGKNKTEVPAKLAELHDELGGLGPAWLSRQSSRLVNNLAGRV